jgi:hypothetical protein
MARHWANDAVHAVHIECVVACSDVARAVAKIAQVMYRFLEKLIWVVIMSKQGFIRFSP